MRSSQRPAKRTSAITPVDSLGATHTIPLAPTCPPETNDMGVAVSPRRSDRDFAASHRRHGPVLAVDGSAGDRPINDALEVGAQP